nr:hypothetical protein [Dehalococcoidia bacterium]
PSVVFASPVAGVAVVVLAPTVGLASSAVGLTVATRVSTAVASGCPPPPEHASMDRPATTANHPIIEETRMRPSLP